MGKPNSYKIVPHLWYDQEARQAAELYTGIFPGSDITNVTTIHDTPSGDCDVVSFELYGQPFMAISAGPMFKFNPSISFHVRCISTDEVDAIWERISDGGKVLMELGEYPFSRRFGWAQDKYGVSWQVIYAGDGEITQRIMPALMFVGKVCGKAEEAINFYSTIFRNSEANVMARYTEGEGPDKEGTVRYAHLKLEGQEFGAMDSALAHDFAFNEAISFMVNCEDQQEIDYYWGRLSAAPEAEQCGWLKDKYGLSWQIVPTALDEMMKDRDPVRSARVMETLMKMKKLDIETLKEAYTQKTDKGVAKR